MKPEEIKNDIVKKIDSKSFSIQKIIPQQTTSIVYNLDSLLMKRKDLTDSLNRTQKLIDENEALIAQAKGVGIKVEPILEKPINVIK